MAQEGVGQAQTGHVTRNKETNTKLNFALFYVKCQEPKVMDTKLDINMLTIKSVIFFTSIVMII